LFDLFWRGGFDSLRDAMDNHEPKPALATQERKADTPADTYMPMPSSSRTAMGCLMLPAVLGGLALLLIAFAISMWIFDSTMSGMGESQKYLRPGFIIGGLPMIAWLLAAMMAFRAMLHKVRKPWVYWLVVVWMGVAVIGSLGELWFVLLRESYRENVGPLVSQLTLMALITWILCWFAFETKNRRYYQLT
jgi:hypothetical protein